MDKEALVKFIRYFAPFSSSSSSSFLISICSTFSNYVGLSTWPDCRVPKPLLCAICRAHGKRRLCRVSKVQRTAKSWAHGKAYFCHVPGRLTHGKQKTHGKASAMPCARQKNTRQTKKYTAKVTCLPCATSKTHGKIFSKNLESAIATFMGNFIFYVGL